MPASQPSKPPPRPQPLPQPCRALPPPRPAEPPARGAPAPGLGRARDPPRAGMGMGEARRKACNLAQWPDSSLACTSPPPSAAPPFSRPTGSKGPGWRRGGGGSASAPSGLVAAHCLAGGVGEALLGLLGAAGLPVLGPPGRLSPAAGPASWALWGRPPPHPPPKLPRLGRFPPWPLRVPGMARVPTTSAPQTTPWAERGRGPAEAWPVGSCPPPPASPKRPLF